jgi:hypothetical protein
MFMQIFPIFSCFPDVFFHCRSYFLQCRHIATFLSGLFSVHMRTFCFSAQGSHKSRDILSVY